MIIFPDWLEFSIKLSRTSFQKLDISKLCKTLGIKAADLNCYTAKSGTHVYTLNLADKESLSFTIPSASHGTLKLRGSFLQAHPDLNIQALWQFVQEHDGNPLRLDISYVDNEGHIDFEEFRRMSLRANYQDYLIGSTTIDRSKDNNRHDSNNRRGVPDPHMNHPLVHYGDIDSNAFVKLYQRPGDFQVKFELTLKDKAKLKALLNLYPAPNESHAVYNQLAKQALVKALSFVTPSSKRAKRPRKIEAYKAFLDGDVKPVNWSEHLPKPATKTFEDTLKHHLGRLVNYMSKHHLNADQEDLYQLALTQLTTLDKLTEETGEHLQTD